MSEARRKEESNEEEGWRMNKKRNPSSTQLIYCILQVWGHPWVEFQRCLFKNVLEVIHQSMGDLQPLLCLRERPTKTAWPGSHHLVFQLATSARKAAE